MTRFRGRASLMIIITIGLTLLITIYHIIGNEFGDFPSDKTNSRLKAEDTFSVNDITENPWSFGRKQWINGETINNAQKKTFKDWPYDNKSFLFDGHKIVHLDLKGAPPKVTYYKHFFQLLKKLGATGILIEYEDMFPFEGKIRNISAGNCYSRKDIADIQEMAKENDLIIIPLVQTFGHMEFVLKLEKYKDLREVLRYPQVLCPTHNETLPLIHEMIDQIVKAHPDIEHLHIGADEVYQIGECSRCLDIMAKRQWGKRRLFLEHVSKVTKYVKQKYPNLSILMWDDEFREITPREITEEGPGSLVEPVVWKYTTDPASTLTEHIWESYSAVWKNIWVATAFKGATAPDRYYTDVSYHLENHRRWLEIIEKYSSRITFKGIILTGWQRYDHFSVLCELLPAAIPSLVIDLAVLRAPDINSISTEVPARILEILQCEGVISLNIPEPQYGWTKCSFHGVSVYAAILRLYSLVQEMNKMEQDNTFKGWFKSYNIDHAFSSPSHVERAVAELDRYKMEIMYIEKEMRTAMEDIYDNYTIQEWLETYVVPIDAKITQLWEAKERILEKDTWPRRPLTKTEL